MSRICFAYLSFALISYHPKGYCQSGCLSGGVLPGQYHKTESIEIPQRAISYFANKHGHSHPDTLQVIPVNFKSPDSHEYLMTFAKDDWNGPEAVWGVVELKNGQWSEPKTIDIDGELKDFSALNFNPANASFVYIPAYKCNGLLTRWRKNWTFTYFVGDAIYTYFFWSPLQVGLTKDALQSLEDANKIKMIRTEVP